MTATMTEPEAKIEEDLLVEYLADSANALTRDLEALATPGEVTLLGGLIDWTDFPAKARKVCYHFARKFSRNKQSVCFVTANTAEEIAGILRAENVDISNVCRVAVNGIATESQIVKAAGQADLCLIWLPQNVSGDSAIPFARAARCLADSGAAVMLVVPFKPATPVGSMMQNIACQAGGVDGIADRVWLVLDHKEAATSHQMRESDCLAPFKDRVATNGYSFTSTNDFPEFRLSYRTNSAEKAVTRPIAHIRLRGE